jgi:hypothetical protein
LTKRESFWGYVASIVHLVFACATSVTALSVVASGITPSSDFSPLLAAALAISIPATLSMAFVAALLALKWSTSVFFRTATLWYLIIGIITYYSTITPIAAWLHPESFGGAGSATRMLWAGIHELEYYFLVSIWIVTLSLTDSKNDLPKYAKIVAYLSGLNILCMITATLLWGHGTVYGINVLVMFILWPTFVTGIIVMMRRLHRNASLGTSEG